MNAFLRRARRGGLLLAAGFGVAACQSYDLCSSNSSCCTTSTSASCKTTGGGWGTRTTLASQVGYSSCADGTCGREGCSRCGGRLHEKLSEFDWEQLRTDHCWPEQYNLQARMRVNAPLHDQIVAGHVTENSLYDFHFDARPEKIGQLSEAGKARVRYLASRKPFVVAGISIQTSFDAAIDAIRQKSVREALDKFSLEHVEWQFTMFDGAVKGLDGPEGMYSIAKMRGPSMGQAVPLPQYEHTMKTTFYQGSGGGTAPTSSGS